MNDESLILVVDDDQRLRSLLQRFLADNGFRVTTAENAAEARDRLRFLQPELIVLDVMMPGESGLSLTHALKAEQPQIPIILLTAAGDPEDRIAGFEAGADDYLPKPFDPRELVLRIRAMLRRAANVAPPTVEAPSGPVPLGKLVFDPARGELRGPTGAIRLTGGEAALLTAMAARAHEVLSREDIAAALGTDESSERAIDVQMTRLRRKIEVDPRDPRYLHTVRGRGYVLKPSAT
ncbi:MAG: response regulator [Acetobacteraceae bacterium]|nr:response regulator [Acetobacteraceae bacterium]